ncbi:TadE/TadG family type IV pilus assembly protein [Streptomyces sp. NPDC050560]|uniref:TadE/TadG family type IV pilus assembly protein n=1 Tax=Streptomyces sp. NPDC050560 TaxID=3365630 RepID=UPI0037AC0417
MRAPTDGHEPPAAIRGRSAGEPRPWRRRARRDDRGQVAIEYVGLLPVLLLVAVAAVQLGLAIFAVQQAGTAARAAARVAAQPDADTDPQTAGRAAVSGWLDAHVSGGGGGGDSVTVTVRVDIPSLVPGVGFGSAERTVTMPRDD